MTEETLIACSHPINKVDISKEPKIRGPRVSPRLPPVPCNDNAKACLSGKLKYRLIHFFDSGQGNLRGLPIVP